MKGYNHQKIEKKWQKEWAKKKIYRAVEKKGQSKSYILDMFPYPSGEGLHVGHPKGYIASDIYARYQRMQGKAVLHPMGWDAFGLPAENYALQNKIHPRVAVKKNIARFKEQLAHIGFDYDWNREINTTDPEYYKWTQWIFLQMFKKGLAYQSNEPINWCPSCKTGLANEDLEGNTCERCGTVVEKKKLPQWVLRITDYAERLLADLEQLPWAEHIKELQRNWIGKSEGAEIQFAAPAIKEKITVFTTRPDTLFGVTYLVLSPEHALVPQLAAQAKNKDEIAKYVTQAAKKTELERQENKEKTGVEIKGVKALHPATKEEISIYIADYVLASYGTGAIMAVPAHDERDFDFSKKFKLPVKQVVEPKFVGTKEAIERKFGKTHGDEIQPGLEFVRREAICAVVRNPKNNTYLCVTWKSEHMHGLVTGGIENGEDLVETARREVREETGYKNLKFIQIAPVAINTFFYQRVKKQNRHAHFRFVFFELENEERDAVSEHEAALHEVVWKKKDELKNFFTVFEGDFLVTLLNNHDYVHTGEGILNNSSEYTGMDSEEAKKKITFAYGTQKTTYKLRDWVFSRQRYWGEPIPIIHCEKCGTIPVPEKDLPVKLPEVKSYAPSGTGESPLANITKWVNTKCPKCGGKGRRETNTMPQWAGSSWYHLRYMDPHNKKKLVDAKKEKYWAPVDVYVGGVEHATRHLIYARFWHKFLQDIGVVSTAEPFQELHTVGLVLAEDGRKMSKRYKNTIDPDDVVKLYGADSLRLYEMFMGPFENTIAWNTESLIGLRRFLERVWRFSEKVGKRDAAELERILHRSIKKVGEDISTFKFNTAISNLMIFLNTAEKIGTIGKRQWGTFVKLLAPFAPHVTEELWRTLGNNPPAGRSIHVEKWPRYDEKLLQEETVTIVIQVDGKVRGTATIAAGSDKAEHERNAREVVAGRLENKEVVKVIVVPNRLVNFVLKR